MSRSTAILILVFAALLEAGGDALARAALRTSSDALRIVLSFTAATVLLGYAYAVNTPPWTFGKLLGLYIVIFFVVAQFTSWLAFHQLPSRSVLTGGALIIVGGLVIALSES